MPVIALALVVIALVAWYMIRFSILITPFALVAAVFFCRSTSNTPPELPDPYEFDDAKDRAKLSAVALQIAPLLAREHAITEEASELGISITKAGQYDQRHKAGRSFNQELDAIRSTLSELRSQFDAIRTEVSDRLPNYRAKFDKWVLSKALYFAAVVGSAAYVVGFLAGWLFSSRMSGFATSLLPTWPVSFASALLCASAISLIVLIVYYREQHSQLSALIDKSRDDDWKYLVDFWRGDRNGSIQSLLIEALSHEEKRNEGSIGKSEADWPSVLGVPEDASEDQIKSAWREKIKEYHPDKVQTLGPKLREIADAETKRLNQAYEAALAAKRDQR